MRTMIVAGMVVAAWTMTASAGLCPKCADGMYIQNIGKCVECGGQTSSGAFKLCAKCGDKLGQCQHCRAPLAPKALPLAGGAVDEALVAECKAADVVLIGTVTSAKVTGQARSEPPIWMMQIKFKPTRVLKGGYDANDTCGYQTKQMDQPAFPADKAWLVLLGYPVKGDEVGFRVLKVVEAAPAAVKAAETACGAAASQPAKPRAIIPGSAPAISAAVVAELIGKLGAADFKAREAATEKLVAMGEGVLAPLEAKAKEKGLDPEVASRIEQVLERLGGPEGRVVTDRASGLTVTLDATGKSLTATDERFEAGPRTIWRVQMSAPATAIQLVGGRVVVKPSHLAVDLRTGQVLTAATAADVARKIELEQAIKKATAGPAGQRE